MRNGASARRPGMKQVTVGSKCVWAWEELFSVCGQNVAEIGGMQRTLVLNYLAGSLELLQGNLGLIWEDQDVPVLVPHVVVLSSYMALLVASIVVFQTRCEASRQLKARTGCWNGEVMELRQI